MKQIKKINSDNFYSKAKLEAIEPIQNRSYSAFREPNPGGDRELGELDSFDFTLPLQQIQNTPIQQKQIMLACMNAYQKIGDVKSVIDTMSNLGSQGIRIVHPNKAKEKLYKYWFVKVKGKERSERILNMLYRAGNIVIKRDLAKITDKDIQDYRRSVASTDPDGKFYRLTNYGKKVIPVEYHILNPWSIDTPGGELATFMGKKVYTLKIPTTIINTIKTPKSPTEKQMVDSLPAFIREPVQRGERFIPLDDDQVIVLHYMKDDWQSWAYPMIFSILDDLSLYVTMKKADKAALRGVISHVRVWLLGSLQHEIAAGEAAFLKLQSALTSNKGGATMDLVWDDALKLIETSTEAHNFLGNKKYEPVIRAIQVGLGLPVAMGGSSGTASGSVIGIKPFIERLQLGRDYLNDFWYEEIRIFKEAIGDKQDASILYDNMNLFDEAAEQMVWVQLLDRDVVSAETMQSRFGLSPAVEAARLRAETRKRGKGNMLPKASPFHNDAQHENSKELAALNQGTVSPTEVGVKKKERQPGDKSLMDMNKEIQTKKAKIKTGANPKKKPKGQPQQGRPKNSPDKIKRKTRVMKKPSVKAVQMLSLMSWAKSLQKTISENITPIYLEKCSKKNVRMLTASQTEELESIKFNILWNAEPMSDVDMTKAENLLPPSEDVLEILEELSMSIYNKKLEELGIEDARELQLSAYILNKGEDDGETNG